jgi:hypothetical protein
VKGPLRTAALVAALGTVPLVVVLLVLAGDRSRALDVYVLFLGGVLMLVLARVAAGWDASRKLLPSRPERSESSRLPELARIEREVVLATGSGFDQQMRVGPLLRDVTGHRLWTQRGIELENEPERAREALGPEIWALVRPGPPDPNSRWRQALSLAELERAVDAIEKI